VSLETERWTPPDRGALFVVTGASGTGKTTLVTEALTRIPGVRFSVSGTTRPPRDGEQHGEDYEFLDRPTFDSKVAAGEFLEWAEVYGNCYGTFKAPVEEALARGESILLDIDTQGAAQVRATMPEAVTIFVLPPDLDVLRSRLETRASDAPDVIEKRMREAQLQLSDCGAFDYLVVNDHLQSAHDQFQAILVTELRRTGRNPTLVARFSD